MKRILKRVIHMAMRGARHLDHPALRNVRFEALAREQDFALVNNGAESFIVLTADKAISRSVYVTGGFEFATFAKVLALLNVDRIGTLVDVGANIGTICIPALARGLAGSAYAIEPEPRNFRALAANVYLNALESKVTLCNVACGAGDDEVLTFEISADNSGDHRVRMSTEGGAFGESSRLTTNVRSRRLDNIIAGLEPDGALIWMDVQGFEGHVLAGAPRILKAGFPMVLEFWPYGMKRAQSFPLMRASLRGYRWFYDLTESQPQPVPLSDKSLDQLYEKLGEGGEHADILVLKDLLRE